MNPIDLVALWPTGTSVPTLWLHLLAFALLVVAFVALGLALTRLVAAVAARRGNRAPAQPIVVTGAQIGAQR